MRKRQPPRLWLRPARERTPTRSPTGPTWHILDGSLQISTGFSEEEKGRAELALQRHIADRYPNGFRSQLRPMFSQLIYFIEITEIVSSPIKIGRTAQNRLQHRLAAMQIGCPFLIQSLGCFEGEADDEWYLHREFETDRIRGEWFRRTDRLLERIVSLCGPPPGLVRPQNERTDRERNAKDAVEHHRETTTNGHNRAEATRS